MLQVNFIMICMIHIILVLLKITTSLKCFLRSIIDFKNKNFFSQHTCLEEENIVKEVKNLRMDTTIKCTRNLKCENVEIKDRILRDVTNAFRPEKGNKGIKDTILRYIRNLFENEEEENCYKPVRVSIFSSNNYIEYESKDDRNKTLSIEKYLKKIRPYLKIYK